MIVLVREDTGKGYLMFPGHGCSVGCVARTAPPYSQQRARIYIDFDASHHLVGIEVEHASSRLRPELLSAASHAWPSPLGLVAFRIPASVPTARAVIGPDWTWNPPQEAEFPDWVEVDDVAKTAYIHLRDRGPFVSGLVARTLPLDLRIWAPGLLLDLDRAGRLVGVDLPLSALTQELLARSERATRHEFRQPTWFDRLGWAGDGARRRWNDLRERVGR